MRRKYWFLLTIFLSLFVLILVVVPFNVSAQEFNFQWGSLGDGNGQFDNPSAIAIDSLNNVYVADTGNDRIQKFNANGEYILEWGSSGDVEGHFNSPLGIGIDSDDQIFVVDSLNNRIQKFNSSGTHLASWGEIGNGNGQFEVPQGVAVDSANNIYVTDSGNDRIQKFDNNGIFKIVWGSTGSDNGQFNSPSAIAISSKDEVFVSDNNGVIQIFDTEGIYNYTIGTAGNNTFSGIMGISFDNDQNLIISEFGNIRIKKLFIGGTWYNQWGVFGNDVGQFDWPYGIAVNSTGKIYVVDSRNNRVQVFGPIFPASHNFDDTCWNYSRTNFRIIEENGLTCEPIEDISDSTTIHQLMHGFVQANFGYPYFGFVSGNIYNLYSTQSFDDLITTEQISLNISSSIAVGKTYYAKTDNLGSYCKMEGDINLTLENCDRDGDGFFKTSSGCFISSVKYY